jgi:hypothetical protein
MRNRCGLLLVALAMLSASASGADCLTDCQSQYNQCVMDVCGGQDLCYECDNQYYSCQSSCTEPDEIVLETETEYPPDAQPLLTDCMQSCAEKWDWYYYRNGRRYHLGFCRQDSLFGFVIHTKCWYFY